MRVCYETFDGRYFYDEEEARRYEATRLKFEVFDEKGKRLEKTEKAISDKGYILVIEDWDSGDYIEQELEIAIDFCGRGVYLWDAAVDEFKLLCNETISTIVRLYHDGHFTKVMN